MNKILGLFFSVLITVFLIIPGYAANTATDLTDLPIKVGGLKPVYPVLLQIDTASADVTVYDTVGNNITCITGWLGVEATAVNVTIKSASTVNTVLELTTNQGLGHPISDGVVYCTAPGEDLVMQFSDVYTYLLLYLISGSDLKFE